MKIFKKFGKIKQDDFSWGKVALKLAKEFFKSSEKICEWDKTNFFPKVAQSRKKKRFSSIFRGWVPSVWPQGIYHGSGTRNPIPPKRWKIITLEFWTTLEKKFKKKIILGQGGPKDEKKFWSKIIFPKKWLKMRKKRFCNSFCRLQWQVSNPSDRPLVENAAFNSSNFAQNCIFCHVKLKFQQKSNQNRFFASSYGSFTIFSKKVAQNDVKMIFQQFL